MSRPALHLAPAAIAAMPPAIAAPPMLAPLAFGHAGIDARLGGGLAVAALHELYAAEGDAAAVAGLALLLATRNGRAGPILWVGDARARREGRLYGLGLADLGVDPARLLLVEAPDSLAMLRASAEAVACRGLAAVIVAATDRPAALDLTATRRLALAAARSGVTTLLLRSGEARPSAANSRWQVAAAASAPLPGNAPGAPVFALTLLRHRGGIAGFSTLLEWDRDRKAFGAAHSGAAPAADFQRAGAAPGRRAA